MELKDTIEMMTSADYKERFKAEYCQLGIRLNKIKRWGKLKPNCNEIFLTEQISYMYAYLCVLQQRARLENVELPDLRSL